VGSFLPGHRSDERTGKVTMRLKRDQVKVFDHRVPARREGCDFLAALARHVPRARQQTVSPVNGYPAGHYANATNCVLAVESEWKETSRCTGSRSFPSCSRA